MRTSERSALVCVASTQMLRQFRSIDATSGFEVSLPVALGNLDAAMIFLEALIGPKALYEIMQPALDDMAARIIRTANTKSAEDKS